MFLRAEKRCFLSLLNNLLKPTYTSCVVDRRYSPDGNDICFVIFPRWQRRAGSARLRQVPGDGVEQPTARRFFCARHPQTTCESRQMCHCSLLKARQQVDLPPISKSEESLFRKIRRTLAQIRTNKSPLLLTYKHKIDPHTHPNPLYPLCKTHDHDTSHLFNCTHIPTHLTPTDLWKNPVEAAALLEVWALRLADL